MVARDRSKEFAAAITEALPHARHIADRWHLVKNLTEHLDKVVSARWKQLAKVGSPAETEPRLISPSPSSRRSRQAPGEARYQQMLILRENGLSTRIIAQQLGVTQRTIQHWLAQEHGPYAEARRPRYSPLDWATPYLQARWEAGERNGTILWEELKAQGYTGSSHSVYRRLAAWRRHPHKTEGPTWAGVAPHPPFEGVTPGKIIGWMLARPEALSSKTREQFERITQMDDTLAEARELTHVFLSLLRHHNSKGLESWLNDVRASTLREFRLFARSLERDKDAVLAGLALPYSTGPVEGYVNRLKLIKREAYGRAGISYLERRFLPAA
jgi:transposase